MGEDGAGEVVAADWAPAGFEVPPGEELVADGVGDGFPGQLDALVCGGCGQVGDGGCGRVGGLGDGSVEGEEGEGGDESEEDGEGLCGAGVDRRAPVAGF